MTITVRGTIYAAPTAPGYSPGMRVIVTAVLDFSAPQIAAIDAVAGGSLAVASVPVQSVSYILTDGTGLVAVTPPSLTATVNVGDIPDARRESGLRNFTLDLADQSGASMHTGNVRLAGYDTIGTVFYSEPPTITPEDPTAGPGSGLSSAWYSNAEFLGVPAYTGPEQIAWSNIPLFDFPTPTPTPHPGFSLAPDSPDFTVRWRGKIKIPGTGPWRFRWHTAGQGSLWINGIKVIDHPTYQTSYLRPVPYSPWYNFEADDVIEVRCDMRKGPVQGVMVLYWEGPGTPYGIVPATACYEFPTPAPGVSITASNAAVSYIEPVNRYSEV